LGLYFLIDQYDLFVDKFTETWDQKIADLFPCFGMPNQPLRGQESGFGRFEEKKEGKIGSFTPVTQGDAL